MAAKPSPDRTDLESKTREDLQTIAKVKGVDLPSRASKAALIEAIMGDSSPSSNGADGGGASRAVRSRRTVATPTDDFDDLLGEFVADASGDNASAPSDATTSTESAPSAPSSTAGWISPSPSPGSTCRVHSA